MSNKLAGLRDFPPPKSWPEAGNSARVFTHQMDDWFSEFTTLTGNDLFTTDEKIKKSFFIKNITDSAILICHCIVNNTHHLHTMN